MGKDAIKIAETELNGKIDEIKKINKKLSVYFFNLDQLLSGLIQIDRDRKTNFFHAMNPKINFYKNFDAVDANRFRLSMEALFVFTKDSFDAINTEDTIKDKIKQINKITKYYPKMFDKDIKKYYDSKHKKSPSNELKYRDIQDVDLPIEESIEWDKFDHESTETHESIWTFTLNKMIDVLRAFFNMLDQLQGFLTGVYMRSKPSAPSVIPTTTPSKKGVESSMAENPLNTAPSFFKPRATFRRLKAELDEAIKHYDMAVNTLGQVTAEEQSHLQNI